LFLDERGGEWREERERGEKEKERSAVRG